jgi:hypothetical protein
MATNFSFNDFLVIDTTGSIGIGSTNPQARLFVTGSITNTGQTTAIFRPATSTQLGGAAVLDIQNSSGGSLLFVSGSGGVGIGTTVSVVPTHKLHVGGKIGGGLFIDSSLEFKSDGTTELKANSDVKLGYALTSVVKSTGNVGIGTLTPSSRLHVYGSSTTTTSTAIIQEGAVPSGGAAALNVQNVAGTTLFFVSGSGRVGIASSSPNARLEVNLGGSNAEILTLKTTYAADNSYHSMTWRDGSNITGQIDTRYNGTTVDMVIGSLYNSGYNSSERMRITGAGNVGIGTASPGTKLDVLGAARASYGVFSGSLVSFASATGALYTYYSGTTAVISANSDNSGNAADLDFFTGATRAMRINTSQNVAIGTATITARLFVSGTSTASTPTMIVREGVASPTGGALAFEVENSAGTTILAVSGSGRVGIGTTPSATITNAKLEVDGSVVPKTHLGSGNNLGEASNYWGTLYANAGYFYNGATNSVAIQGNTFQVYSQTSSPAAYSIYADANNRVGIGASSISTARLIVSGTSTGTNTSLLVRHGVPNGSNLPVLDVQNSAGTSILFVSGSGNVGIGTNSPQALLHVGAGGGTPEVPATAYVTAAGTTNLAIRDSTSNVELLNYAYSGGGLIGTATSHSLGIRTANVTALTIDTSQRVGIGTVTPGEKLSIHNGGQDRVGFGITSVVSTIYLGSTINAEGYRTIEFDRSTGKLSFGYGSVGSALSTAMTIDGSGNVGVGVSTLTARLHVGSVSETVALKLHHAAASGYGYAQFGDSATESQNWHIGSEGDGSFRWYSGNWGTGTELMRINSAGNVGIGTNNPLSVAGYTWLTLNGTSGGVVSNMVNGTEVFRIQSDGAAHNINGFSDVPLVFYTNNAERMRITNTTGRVGIGTANPTAKLHVEGGDALINSHTVGRGSASADSTNVAVGSSANSTVTSGQYNTSVGFYANRQSNGSENTVVGYVAMDGNTASYNTAVGSQALYAVTSGPYNTAVGYKSLYSAGTSNYSVGVGAEAGYGGSSAGRTAIGYQALAAAAAAYTTAVGYRSLNANTTGVNNVGLGAYTLEVNDTGDNNTAVGANALLKLLKYHRNTAVGAESMANSTQGQDSVAVGYKTLYSTSTDVANVAVGSYSLQTVAGGSYNVGIGYSSLYSVSTGGFNVAVGPQAGTSITSGGGNVVIGGYGAGGSFATQSNNIFISDGNATLRMMITSSNGGVGIGTTSWPGGVSAGTTTLHTYRSAGNSLVAQSATNASELDLIGRGTSDITGSIIVTGGTGVTPEMQLGSLTNHALAFFTNNTRSITVDTSQRVGVGTATPDTTANTKLHVYNGNAIFNNTYGINWTGLSGPTNGTRTATTLDHYDYGTWTPAFQGSSSAGTYNLANTKAYYVRVGKLVVVSMYTEMTATGYAAGSGDWRITGLPYSSSSGVGIASVGKYSGLATSVATISGVVEEGNTYVDMYVTTVNATSNTKAAIATYVGTATKIAMTITFRVT